MSCVAIRSVFEKPWKFGGLDAIRTVLDYTNSRVEIVTVTDPTQYRVGNPCPYPLDIWWLNRHGGYDRFVFNTPRERFTDVEEDTRYVDGNGIERIASLGAIRKRLRVTSQFLDKATREAVASLLISVQVYELTATGQKLPINIVKESFRDYSERDQGMIVTFSFTYGELIQVQSQ